MSSGKSNVYELPYTVHSHQPIDPRTGNPHAVNYDKHKHHALANLKSGYSFTVAVKNFFLLSNNFSKQEIAEKTFIPQMKTPK